MDYSFWQCGRRGHSRRRGSGPRPTLEAGARSKVHCHDLSPGVAGAFDSGGGLLPGPAVESRAIAGTIVARQARRELQCIRHTPCAVFSARHTACAGYIGCRNRELPHPDPLPEGEGDRGCFDPNVPHPRPFPVGERDMDRPGSGNRRGGVCHPGMDRALLLRSRRQLCQHPAGDLAGLPIDLPWRIPRL